MPSPTLTPRLRSNHQMPAPAIPANPVPLDHAPSAVRDVELVGKVVVNCRKVSSPNPDDSDAKDMPKSRRYSDVERAMIYLSSVRCGEADESSPTMIPNQLQHVQNPNRRPYLI